jgi:hypothetical protein
MKRRTARRKNDKWTALERVEHAFPIHQGRAATESLPPVSTRGGHRQNLGQPRPPLTLQRVATLPTPKDIGWATKLWVTKRPSRKRSTKTRSNEPSTPPSLTGESCRHRTASLNTHTGWAPSRTRGDRGHPLPLARLRPSDTGVSGGHVVISGLTKRSIADADDSDALEQAEHTLSFTDASSSHRTASLDAHRGRRPSRMTGNRGHPSSLREGCAPSNTEVLGGPHSACGS